MQEYDVAVIGQGYAGLSAARAAVDRGLRTVNFEAMCMGGLITNVNELDPTPCEEHGGAQIAGNLWMGNHKAGVVAVGDEVVAVERDDEGNWVIRTEDDAFRPRVVIVASGAKLKKLGIAGELEYYGQGVSECADCDGPLFSGMETIVVGGGDAAFQEALALAEYASKVTIVMRGDGPRARADFVERAIAEPRIEQMTNTRVLEVLGEQGKGVTGVRLAQAGSSETVFACQGVFVFIGLEPNAGYLPSDVVRDADGALITSETGATSVPGLWAVGAVRSGFGGMLTDAAADAARTVAAIG